MTGSSFELCEKVIDGILRYLLLKNMHPYHYVLESKCLECILSMMDRWCYNRWQWLQESTLIRFIFNYLFYFIFNEISMLVDLKIDSSKSGRGWGDEEKRAQFLSQNSLEITAAQNFHEHLNFWVRYCTASDSAEVKDIRRWYDASCAHIWSKNSVTNVRERLF